MQYMKATIERVDEIYDLVQQTIVTIYPIYYPQDVVCFFSDLHNKENIANDINKGHVWILLQEDRVIGTGSCIDNHITRVFVNPTLQGQGYGSYIMNCLEKKIACDYDKIYLEASLSACCVYEKRGYKTVKHEKYNVNNNAVLVYVIMDKQLR